MYTSCCAVLQKSRAKDDKILTWDMMVDTLIPIHSNIGQGREFILRNCELAWKERAHSSLSRKNIFYLYQNREMKSTGTNNVNDADRYLAKNCQQSGNGDGRAVRS